MPASMTQHEWQDQITLTMTLAEVRNIADFAGIRDPAGAPVRPGLFAVDWKCANAWHPDKSARGWFDVETTRLVDKNIVA